MSETAPIATPARSARATWRRWLLAAWLGSIVVVSAQQVFVRLDNNFRIFRAAPALLRAGQNLYAPHPELYLDIYKYSPTFVVLFVPFATLPVAAAILLWSALNAMLLWYAVSRLLPGARGTAALALVSFEVLRNMQRAQSNSLVAALVVLAYLAFEQRRQLGAAGAIAAGAFIKIFPLAALALAALHPRRVRFALVFAGVMLAGIALPLVLTSPHGLLHQYAWWRQREAIDALAAGGRGGGGLYGGVMEQFRIWFGVHWPNWPLQLAGTALLLLPLAVRRDAWHDPVFRLRYLCSLLIYMVIFNHQAESPSFVIAVTGIAIWYVAFPRTRLTTSLMVLTLVVVSLSSTEITPHWLQREVFVRYKLKTVPCTLVWLVLQAELLGLRPNRSGERAEVHEGDVAALQPRAHG